MRTEAAAIVKHIKECRRLFTVDSLMQETDNSFTVEVLYNGEPVPIKGTSRVHCFISLLSWY